MAAALTVQALHAVAQDQTVELKSQDNGYNTYALPEDVTQVDLLEQLQGKCRFNRTWGFDLTHRELWVDGGCSGRFKFTRPEARDSGNHASNVALAAAVVAGGPPPRVREQLQLRAPVRARLKFWTFGRA